MVCENSSCPYITLLVPSGAFKPFWQTGLPSCRPGTLFCLTHPQHNCQLSSNCRIFITRDDWNYKKNPAEFFTSCWVSTRTGPLVSASSSPQQLSLVHVCPDCRKLLAVDRCYLPSALKLPPQNASWWPWEIRLAILHSCRQDLHFSVFAPKYLACVHAHSVTKSCLTLCGPMDYSLSSSSVHGIFQARKLKRVAISFSRGSSQPRDWTCVFCIGRWILYHRATREAQVYCLKSPGSVGPEGDAAFLLSP